MKTIEENFVEALAQIKSPVFFIGVCNTLGVSLMEDKKPRDAAELLGDVIDEFQKMPRGKRKELVSLIKKANKAEKKSSKEKTEEVETDGSGTENS